MQDENGKIIDRREMLRVKVKSLAAEAHIIRREERKSTGALRDELHIHRVGVVRYEARHSLLAYGLIRGRSIEQMERSGSSEPNWKDVRKMLTKYGPAGRQWEELPGYEPTKPTSMLQKMMVKVKAA